ncbi:MAG: glycerol-3-phosphate dehydrogenase [Bacteroidales bacterium]|nr:glycerol-3-phosphate dehydrogenase [Bacteroidales bacterium]
MESHSQIAVLGGGSWATAIVKILLENVDGLNWYLRKKENIQHIKTHHHNPNYLSSINLDIDKLSLFDDINETIAQSGVLIFAIPAPYLKEATKKIHVDITNKIVVSAIKGIIPEDNLIIGDFFNQKYNVSLNNFVVITGPCHSEEVALERLSYLTVASQDIQHAKIIAEFIRTFYIKTILSDDIYGTQYAAILKNIFAIVAGVCHGLRYGDNFFAVLISNAIQEIKRVVDAVHPITRDIKSSAYLGDLLVTAYSQFSRNRTFGTMIGKGYSVKSAILEMSMVAEGYYATKCITEMNKTYKLNLPITEAAYNILYENISPAVEIKLLSKNLT